MKCNCLKCGYQWEPRGYSINKVPKKCPKCFNPNWNRKKNIDTISLLIN